MPKSKPKQGKSILYVKVASLADICRYAFSFDFASKSLLMPNGDNKIIALGECIGDTTIAYYVHAQPGSKILHYTFPSSADNREKVGFAERMDDQGRGYLRIISLDLSHFTRARSLGKDDVSLVEIRLPEDMMAAAIKKAIREENFMHLYSFEYGEKRYLCGFDLFDELADDRKTLYYSVLGSRSTAGFARYKYLDNTFDFTDTVEEHSYIYVKIINLAEPFQFFKPA